MGDEEMKKKKEYIIAGSLLSLAIVGMVFAYNTESGDKKSQEKEEQQVAFQEVEKDKETAKDEVEDVSSILKAERKKGRTKAGAETESRDTEGRSKCSKGRAEGAGDSK